MGVLVRESVNNPQKLKDRRDKELIDNKKRLAIEDVVTAKLKANIPIVRA